MRIIIGLLMLGIALGCSLGAAVGWSVIGVGLIAWGIVEPSKLSVMK